MSLVNMDPKNAPDVTSVASQQQKDLPSSPVALVGTRFVEEFYYSKLVEAGLVQCLIYRVDGRVAGFLSYTRYPADFIGRGIRKYWPSLTWIMLRTVLARPATIQNILAAMKFTRGGNRAELFSEPGMIEALSLVVPPEHQKLIPPGGKSRLPVRFISWMGERAVEEGANQVLYAVEPRNKASNILFSSLGCEFNKVQYAGQTVHMFTHRVGAQQRDDR
jgi:hypothetical protein